MKGRNIAQCENPLKNLFLIRHAESQKNILEKHGGKGLSLTFEGKLQSERISDYLLYEENIQRGKTVLFFYSVPQVKETAEIICKKNKYIPKCDESIQGYNFGVLSGLSRKEASDRYPNVAHRIEKWRRGILNPLKLEIPEGEDHYRFHNRIHEFMVKNIFANDFTNMIIIGTSSLLIMATNILLMGIDFSFNKYKPFGFNCGSITKFSIAQNKVLLEYINYRGHLSRKRGTMLSENKDTV